MDNYTPIMNRSCRDVVHPKDEPIIDYEVDKGGYSDAKSGGQQSGHHSSSDNEHEHIEERCTTNTYMKCYPPL